MLKSKTYCIVLLLFAFMIINIQGDEEGVLIHIEDHDGVALQHQGVNIKNEQGKVVSTAASDKQGNIYIHDLPCGSYEITSVKRHGYQVNEPIELIITKANQNDSIRLDITLKKKTFRLILHDPSLIMLFLALLNMFLYIGCYFLHAFILKKS